MTNTRTLRAELLAHLQDAKRIEPESVEMIERMLCIWTGRHLLERASSAGRD